MDLLHTSLHKSDWLHYCMCSLTVHKHVIALSSIYSQSYHHHVKLLRTMSLFMNIIVTAAVDVKLSSSSTSSPVAYQAENIHAILTLSQSSISHSGIYFSQKRLSRFLCTIKTLMHTLHHYLYNYHFTSCHTYQKWTVYQFANCVILVLCICWGEPHTQCPKTDCEYVGKHLKKMSNLRTEHQLWKTFNQCPELVLGYFLWLCVSTRSEYMFG